MDKKDKNIQELSKEELTKTQVLNLSTLQQVANYEKKTSKKPAIIIAVIGLLLISSGIVAPIAMTSLKENTIQKREVPKKERNHNLTCRHIQLGTADGIDITITATINFHNNQAKNYTKRMDITKTVGKEELADISLPTILTAYKSLETTEIKGYTLFTEPTTNGIQSTLLIDLTQLDKTKLTDAYNNNIFLKADFPLNMTAEEVKQILLAIGYICE